VESGEWRVESGEGGEVEGGYADGREEKGRGRRENGEDFLKILIF
jgi:hypothetical protein